MDKVELLRSLPLIFLLMFILIVLIQIPLVENNKEKLEESRRFNEIFICTCITIYVIICFI